MSTQAKLYILSVWIAGIAFAGYAIFVHRPVAQDWWAFGFLTLAATAAQLLKSIFRSRPGTGLGSVSFSPMYIFLLAGVLLLSPLQFLFLVLIPHVIEWGKERYRKTKSLPQWYIQPFNISTHIVCGALARAAITLLPRAPMPLLPLQIIEPVTVVVLYVAVNYLLIGQALVLVRRLSFKEAGIFSWEGILPDLMMANLGCAVAYLWTIHPVYSLFALSPLVMIQRALAVPQLKKEARIDTKTGLWNARHFGELFSAEFERAKRFNHGLALIVADLDLLRNINNTYGHLAGDNVLAGVGEIIRDSVREYDVAARFGGEEFIIAMPEALPFEAAKLAERIRIAVQATDFYAATSHGPIRATISLGTAYFPQDATTPPDLIHAADLAVYQAKVLGRNRIASYSDLPTSLTLDKAVGSERLLPADIANFFHDDAAQQLRQPAVAASSQAEASPGQNANRQNMYPAGAKPQAQGPSRNESESPRPPAQIQLPDKAQPRKLSSRSQSDDDHASKRSMAIRAAFIALIIVCAATLTLSAVLAHPQVDWTLIGILAVLVVVSEMLHVDQDGNTISVATSFQFAAVLLTGLPGLVVVSAANALSHRLLKPALERGDLVKTSFNWSNHILSGMPAVMLMQWWGSPLNIDNLSTYLLPVFGAGVLYFVIETGLLSVVLGLSQGLAPRIVWKSNFRWLAGHYVVFCLLGVIMAVAFSAEGLMGLLIFTIPPIMMRYAQIQYVQHTREGMVELRRMNQELTHANGEITRASRSIQKQNQELFLTLAKIIDARDPYVAGHASKVSEYAAMIAQELGLSEERTAQVAQAALLHDIGKLGIPENILHKPAHLTPEEYEFVKTHTVLGGDFLATSEGLKHLAPFVKHHHEWWNGTGYPDQLRGEQIPLEARILCVCDAVESMASDRPYHTALPLEAIAAEIRRCADTQFDPKIAEICVRVILREKTNLVTNSARVVREKKGKCGQWQFIPLSLNAPTPDNLG